MSKQNSQKLPPTFWWANFTQFGGAMNDNLFKLFMIFALLSWNGVEARPHILASVGLAFAIPFILIIPVAGSFADHYSKRSVIVVLKAVEIAVMLFGLGALYLRSEPMLYATMLLMSAQSAFFGPCKYGIIPEQVNSVRLSRANGVIQMFTYLAILAGTVVAPALSETFGDYHHKAASFCILVAVAGFLCSLKIEPTPSHSLRPISFNGFINLVRSARLIRRDGFLALAVLAGSLFTLIGAFTQLNVIDFGMQHLGLTEEQCARLFLLTAMGIGIGSIFAGWISGRSIEFGIVPVGTVIMLACLVVIGTVPEGSVAVVRICMFLIGIGAGFYVVPLEAFIQYRSPGDKVGSVKAANGFLSWIGVVLASGLLYLNSSVLEITAQQGFLVVSVLLFVLAILSFWVLPDFFVRFVIMCSVRSFYRLRVYGLENLPSDRAALLVCNHVSLADALLVISSQQRRIRVLMSREVYRKSGWVVRRVVHLSGVILIHDSDGPKQLILSLKEARKALDDGFLVCVFAEGGLTLSGMMKPFKPGFERIIRGSDHPVIPVYIGGAWGSCASWKNGRARLDPLGDFRHPVSVHFGEALPSSATAQEVQQAVCMAAAGTFELLKSRRRSMGKAFVHAARKYWNQTAVIVDGDRNLTFGELLVLADRAGCRLLQQLPADESRIGIAVRKGSDNLILQVALALKRRILVPIDPDEPEPAQLQRIVQAKLETVITDTDPAMHTLPVKYLPVGDFLQEAIQPDSFTFRNIARWKPDWVYCPMTGFDPDEVATIQFTRGTCGPPKAVQLSHHNILSNVEALREILRPDPGDTLLGVVPLSNVYGYTIATWLPLLSGMRIVHTPQPFDVDSAGRLARKYSATILPAVPGFIRNCVGRLPAEQLASLKFVFTGGAPLDPETAEQFREKFGTVPLEGYGATELSPVCSLSLPDVRVDRYSETGHRINTTGRLLQGVAVKITDPGSGMPLGSGETGRIMVKGPNVMIGYYNDEASTSEVLRDGWYHTGDLGSMDDDGFLTVLGRR